MKELKYRRASNPEHNCKGLDCSDDPGRTDQSFKDECDINTIMAQYLRGVPIRHTATGQPLFEDFTTAPDFLQAMQTIAHAQEQFAALDSSIRNRFQNNPAAFLDFINNEANRDEAIKLGIIDKPRTPPAPAAPATPPPGGDK